MSEVKKIATRDSYGNALAQLGTEHPEVVVLDADLAAATKTGIFKKAYPERFIDCGIAESNMIGVAAGQAAEGKVPFASAFAMSAMIFAVPSTPGRPSYTTTRSARYVAYASHAPHTPTMMKSCSTTNAVRFACRM